MKTRTVIYVLLFALLVASAGLAGCAEQAGFTYEDLDRELSSIEIRDVHTEIAGPPFLDAPVTEAPELRQSALISLREQGAEQAELANLLTAMFPQEARSVPYYAEAVTVDGRSAWLVLEVWGTEGGVLDNGRTWVLDRDSEEIMTSVTYRLQ